MPLPHKPSQPRDTQFTTDFPQLPSDASPHTREWLRFLITRLKSDHETIEAAFAKLREDLDVSTRLTAIEAQITAIQTAIAGLGNNRWLVFNDNVAPTAGIVESKLALNFPTHSNVNDPTANQKAALVGTFGTPSSVNRYVTNQDPRLAVPSPVDEAEREAALIAALSIPTPPRAYADSAMRLLAMLPGPLFATEFARSLLYSVDAAALKALIGGISQDMLLYRQQESSGTTGGVFNSGAWTTVPLNTEVVDTAAIGSIASNEVTLPAGTYRYQFGVIAGGVGDFQGRLWNVTDAALIADSYSSVVTADDINTSNAEAPGQGRFTLDATEAIRLEARGSANGTFGAAGSFGNTEVYSWLLLWKE